MVCFSKEREAQEASTEIKWYEGSGIQKHIEICIIKKHWQNFKHI